MIAGLRLPDPMHLLLASSPRVRLPDGSQRELAGLDAALLAWLAIEGPTPRSRLGELLWHDKEGDAARNSLRQRLFRLRAQLGTDLVGGTTTLALAPGVTHDLDDADGVLAALDDPRWASGEFSRWLDQQRIHRRERRGRVLAEQAEAAEAVRAWDDALGHARALLALEPLSEEAHRRVMRLHYLAGDRAAALLAFDRCAQLLEDEVGAKPSEATLALLRTLGDAAPAAPPPVRGLPAAVMRPPRMVGRDDELREVRSAWAARRVAWVLGEAGLGKSRLLQELQAQRPGALLVSARPGDHTVPFASLARLMRALGAGGGPTALRPPDGLPARPFAIAPAPQTVNALLAAADAPPREAGALSSRASGVPASPGASGERGEVYRIMRELLRAAWSRGIGTLMLDDLHFADAASLEWIVGFLQAEASLPWSLALAQRPDEGDALLARARDALLDEGRLHERRLQPLAPQQMAELVASLGIEGVDAAALAPTLHRHTGGNPLFALETLRQMLNDREPALATGDGLVLPRPTTVTRLIGRRLARLTPQALRLARCAAVAGQDFSIDLAMRVTGATALDLADGWDELERAQVLRDGAFAHDLIHEATLASVPRVIAAHLHGQIADWMLQHGAPPGRLAQHLDHAGRSQEAAAAYRRAADDARRGAEVAQALQLLELAAACLERADDGAARFDVLHERARLLAEHDFSRLSDDAVRGVEEAAKTPRQQIEAQLLRLGWLEARGLERKAIELAPTVMAAARELDDLDLEVTAALRWCYGLCDDRQAARGVELLSTYVPRLGQLDSEVLRFEFCITLAFALDYADQLRDALGWWERALALPGIDARADLVWQAQLSRAATLSKLGRVSASADAGLDALRVARSAGELPAARLAKLESIVAHRLRDLGRYGEAIRMLEQARDAFDGATVHFELAWIEHRLCVTYQQLGQPERARHLLQAERPHVHVALAMMRLVHRADVARQLGGEGRGSAGDDPRGAAHDPEPRRHLPPHRHALRHVAVPPDEGEAHGREPRRLGCRARAPGCGDGRPRACRGPRAAAERGGTRAAARRGRAAPRPRCRARNLLPARALARGREGRAGPRPRARRTGARGGGPRAWIQRTHDEHVPDAFRHSFLHRNAVNVELLAWAGCRLA